MIALSSAAPLLGANCSPIQRRGSSASCVLSRPQAASSTRQQARRSADMAAIQYTHKRHARPVASAHLRFVPLLADSPILLTAAANEVREQGWTTWFNTGPNRVHAHAT